MAVDQHSHVETGISLSHRVWTAGELENQLVDLRKRRQENLAASNIFMYLSITALTFIFIILFTELPDFSVAELVVTNSKGALSSIAFFYGIMLFTAFRNLKTNVKMADQEIHELKFEIELMGYEISERQIRAERLFRRNENDLSQYYKLNLRQNRWMMGVGVGCIVSGLVIVFVTLAVVFGFFDEILGKSPDNIKDIDVWIKGIVAAVGAVGSIMVNVVAAIYLQMHSKAADALGEFHKRLVDTNQLFLSNVLASRIQQDEKREALLVDLSMQISGGR